MPNNFYLSITVNHNHHLEIFDLQKNVNISKLSGIHDPRPSLDGKILAMGSFKF